MEQVSIETWHNTHVNPIDGVGQLHIMKMIEGESIQEYLNNAEELKSQLPTMV